MQAVILSGGHGRRLYSTNARITKPMLPLFDRPILEHTITLLAKHGITDIILTASYEAKEVISYFGQGSPWGVNIRYSIEGDALGTAGAVKRVQKFINDTALVISADAITDFDITSAIDAHKSASAIATIMLSAVDDPSDYGLVDFEKGGKITRIIEKPKTDEIFTNIVSTGIYIIEPEALSCIPYNQVCDFSRDVFPRMLSNQEPVYGFTIPGYWCDAGNINNYRCAHFDALRQKLHLDLPAVHIGDGVWLGERVDIHPTVDLSSPIFIGNGVTIRKDVKLGERTIIGTDAWIDEGSYIARSIIGCKSYIGKDTRITNSITGTAHSVSDGDRLEGFVNIERVSYQPARYSTANRISRHIPAQGKPEQTEVRNPITRTGIQP